MWNKYIYKLKILVSLKGSIFLSLSLYTQCQMFTYSNAGYMDWVIKRFIYLFLFFFCSQSYGSKYLIALHNLKKVGLLVEQPPLLPQNVSISNKVEKAASKTASKIAEKVVTAFPRYRSFKTIAKKFDLASIYFQ